MKITSKKAEKYISLFLILVFIISLIPILWIGKYNYLSADDYGFSANTHVLWQETHSVVQALKGACETVIDRWHTWQGTFSTMFLMALQPAVWSESWYSLVPFLMIGSISLSTLYFLHVLLEKVMGVRRALYISISMIYLIFTLQCMIDKTQAFYWFNGAAHYILPHCAALLLISLWVLIFTEKKRAPGKFMICCFLSIFLGGSNYITALVIAILYSSAIFLLCISKNRREWKLLLFPFGLFMISFLLNALAPGNAVRQALNTNRPGVIKSILLSFYYCIEYTTDIWFDWTYLIFILALLPFIWEVVKTVGNRFTYRFPLFVIGFSYCLLSSMFTPSLYASGIAGGGRIFNIIFLDAALLIIGNLFYFMGWFYTHIVTNSSSASCLIQKDIQIFLLGLLSLTIFIGLLYSASNPNYFTTTSAVTSLISGEGAAYGEEGEKRS